MFVKILIYSSFLRLSKQNKKNLFTGCVVRVHPHCFLCFFLVYHSQNRRSSTIIPFVYFFFNLILLKFYTKQSPQLCLRLCNTPFSPWHRLKTNDIPWHPVTSQLKVCQISVIKGKGVTILDSRKWFLINKTDWDSKW